MLRAMPIIAYGIYNSQKKKNMIPRVTSSLDTQKKEDNRVSSSLFFGVFEALRAMNNRWRERETCVKSARFFLFCFGSLSTTKKRERNAQKKEKKTQITCEREDKKRRALFFTSSRARDRERAKKKANERCLLEERRRERRRGEESVGEICGT